MEQLHLAPQTPKPSRFNAEAPSRAEIFQRIEPFARANSLKGYMAFAFDLTLFVAGISSVLLVEPLAWKVAGSVLAGLALVNLGSLSHEAAHGAVVKSKLGNKFFAVLSLTMILFNYRLWICDHHLLHHGKTNVKNNNFLSPPTLAEYRNMSRLRRTMYRVYHSETGIGILLYYLLERWPGVHFYPGEWVPQRFRKSAWGYCALEVCYIAGLLSILVLVSSAQGASVATAVILGFVVPYLIWFTTFAMTAFLQHTNPELRWYAETGSVLSQPELQAVQVVIPAWMNHITHYVLEHPVHHVAAMIPHYHLKKAQAALAEISKPAIIVMKFTVGNMRDVLRRCRLYDYDQHVWTDFDGNITAVPLETAEERQRQVDRAGASNPNTNEGIFFPGAGQTDNVQSKAAESVEADAV